MTGGSESIHATTRGVRIEERGTPTLTKRAKTRIKQWYREGLSSGDILARITYPEGAAEAPYTDMAVDDQTAEEVVLRFSRASSSPEEREKSRRREALRSRIRALREKRTNTYRSDAWRAYERLVQHPMMRSMTDDQRRMLLPDPRTVKSSPDTYRLVLRSLPQSPLRDYFEIALAECDASSSAASGVGGETVAVGVAV